MQLDGAPYRAHSSLKSARVSLVATCSRLQLSTLSPSSAALERTRSSDHRTSCTEVGLGSAVGTRSARELGARRRHVHVDDAASLMLWPGFHEPLRHGAVATAEREAEGTHLYLLWLRRLLRRLSMTLPVVGGPCLESGRVVVDAEHDAGSTSSCSYTRHGGAHATHSAVEVHNVHGTFCNTRCTPLFIWLAAQVE